MARDYRPHICAVLVTVILVMCLIVNRQLKILERYQGSPDYQALLGTTTHRTINLGLHTCDGSVEIDSLDKTHVHITWHCGCKTTQEW